MRKEASNVLSVIGLLKQLTLALNLMSGVNRSPKQRAPVAPQNGDLSPQK